MSAPSLMLAQVGNLLGKLNSGDFALADTDQHMADVDGAHVVSSDNPSVKTVDVLDGSQQVRICGRVVYGCTPPAPKTIPRP